MARVRNSPNPTDTARSSLVRPDPGTRTSAVGVIFLSVLSGGWGLFGVPGCTKNTETPPLSSGSQATGGQAASGELQSAAMSFADRYVAAIADAADRSAADGDLPELTRWTLRYKFDTAMAAFTVASGASPTVSVLDLTSLVTLRRMVLEEYWTTRFPPGSLGPLIETSKTSEADIWSVVAKLMSEQQQTDLHALIKRWRKDNPDQQHVANVRFSSFDSYRNQATDVSGRGGGSIFSLLYLDPFPNLDPTVREIAQIRRLVERESYFFERFPLILQYQMALFVQTSAAIPEVTAALADAARFSKATDRFATATEHFAKDIGDQAHGLIDQLDTKVAAERKAALDQAAEIITAERVALSAEVSKILDRQREALTADIDAREKQARELLADIRATSDRLDALSKSVHGTVDAIEELSKPTPTPPGQEPSRPFDVREYQSAANSIASAAKDATILMQSLDATFKAPATGPVDTTLYGAAVARLDESVARAVNHLFIRSLILLLVGLAGAGAIVLVSRKRKNPQSPG